MKIHLQFKKLYNGNSRPEYVPDAIVNKYKKRWYIDNEQMQYEHKLLINLWLVQINLKWYKWDK